MDRQHIIERIKKCLTLSKGSSFAGEAEQALAAAMRLAAGIGMTVDQIKLTSEAENDRPSIGKNVVDGKVRSKIPQFEIILATGLAQAIGCELIVHAGFHEATRKTAEWLILIGTPADAILFNWLYPFIVSQLRRLCHRDWKGWESSVLSETDRKKWERSWYRGASLRVIQSAKEKFKEQTTEQEQQQYALVVRDKLETVRQFMNQSFMNLKNISLRTRKTDSLAMNIGWQSGGEVSMNKPIEEKKKQSNKEVQNA